MPQLDPPLHQMTKAEFVGAYGGVYEHSRWVAEAVWENGLDPTDVDAERLAGKMAVIVEFAGRAGLQHTFSIRHGVVQLLGYILMFFVMWTIKK